MGLLGNNHHRRWTRRGFVKGLGLAPLLFRPSPLHGLPFFGSFDGPVVPQQELPFSDARYIPHYPARSPLEGVLRLVAPGSDEYIEERYAAEIGTILERWGQSFKSGDFGGLSGQLDPAMEFTSLTPARTTKLRSSAVECFRREYASALQQGAQSFLKAIREWIGREAQVETAGFEITALETMAAPDAVEKPLRLTVRYNIVASYRDGRREQRSGQWLTEWLQDGAAERPKTWKLRRWQAGAEMLSVTNGPVFIDVTEQWLGRADSYRAQMLHGSDHWRTVLDGACGIDVYGNNGIAAGDFDDDGFDDLYVSQPAGLPNRLYRNRGDGSFDDVTDAAGVGVLDNTSCALFADLRNSGLQDLLVVCGSGPLLFVNQGDGTFKRKPDAFRFARTPQGTFTHAAIADYDGDGRLDIYFCLYSYYLGLDQYHYPVPYFDARNGPPNFLLHNEGDGTFTDRTEAAGLNADNDRYSFACAWGQTAATGGLPDLYVVNDFGRNNLYRSKGDGTFASTSAKAHVEDVGAGMSACWADYNNDGLPDLYAANMWSAAGQRVSQQARFHERAIESTRELYRRHAEGNALYENQGGGHENQGSGPENEGGGANKGGGSFRSAGQQAGVDRGGWAWCSDFWDFDHDGYSDLYVANGYISAPGGSGASADEGRPDLGRPDLGTHDLSTHDLGSFFWRQVVAKSPEDATPSLAYEHGWNAINELIRSDSSWSGFERNVMFANNRDGTFSDVSGAVGMDLLEDGRSFALADIDHDGRLEVIVKNRNAPQLRILRNAMREIGDSIAFSLRGAGVRGIGSNRDAIGAAITVTVGELRQTKYLQAGSGFLAQHSKQVFFGLGAQTSTAVSASIRWPSGLTQQFEALPRNSRIHIVEGTATFEAKPFASAPALGEKAAAVAAAADDPSPTGVETWLLDPLKAPMFSLPDLSGAMQQLQSLLGERTVLMFWAAKAPLSVEQLASLEAQRTALAAAKVKVVAVNVDTPAGQDEARLLAKKQRLSFPVLFATDEVAGIYNIVYRYLFDRRRDLPIPVAFLLDREGMIVKVYQGKFAPEQMARDAQAIPATPAERMRKALPFAGTLHLSEFVRNDYTYGVAMFQHGYLEQAEESFKQVVAAKPNNAEGYYNLGTLKLRKNDFAEARSYLQQTLKLKPDYPEAWNNLGIMAAQEGHADEAIESFTKSLALRPGYATALLNLGNVYRRKGDAAKAQDCLTRALELQPDDPEANYSLGMLYAQQGQLQPAEEYLRKAIELRPDYAEALNNLGVIFVRRQDYAMAEAQFRTCIRVVPEFDQSYLNLARLYVVEHDKAKATATLEELLRLRPESAAAKQGLQALEGMP